jgi:hypothetical protein
VQQKQTPGKVKWSELAKKFLKLCTKSSIKLEIKCFGQRRQKEEEEEYDGDDEKEVEEE